MTTECLPKPYLDISEEDACQLVIKSFLAASEREISIGDGLEIWIQRHVLVDETSSPMYSLSSQTVAAEYDDNDASVSIQTKMPPLLGTSRVGMLGFSKKRSRIVLEKKFYALPQH
jgi:hypothetical protein